MNIIYYDKNKNCYRERNIKQWAVNNKLDYIIELHKNSSSNSSATGTGVLIKSGTNNKNIELATKVFNVLNKYFKKWSTGVVYRDNLYNMNVIEGSCNYSLLEICFNSNDNDNNVLDNNIENIGNDLYITLKESGIKNLGVIYGHGNGDPGAVNGTRYEADEVRRIEVKEMTKPIELDNTPDSYAKLSVDKAIEKGILKGDTNGNLMLHSNVSRQDLMVFFDRLRLLD